MVSQSEIHLHTFLNVSFYFRAVKQLITISCSQNKCLCVCFFICNIHVCIYIHRIHIHSIQTNVNTDYYFECDESFDSPICIICLFFCRPGSCYWLLECQCNRNIWFLSGQLQLSNYYVCVIAVILPLPLDCGLQFKHICMRRKNRQWKR